MLLLLSIILLGLVAAISPWISRALGKLAGPVLAIAPAAVFGLLLSYAAGVTSGTPVVQTTEWLPQLGIDLTFRLDGLSLIFGLLITGIGTLIVLYASEYLKDHELRHRFFCFLMSFMTAMLGVVLTDNLIVLFVFWEMTSITSFLLIGFDHNRETARKSAMQALIVTGLGGLALLAGLFLLGVAAGEVSGAASGVWSLGAIIEIAQTQDLASHAFIPAILALVGLGAATKSAQFPFHFWLPNAMEAPTPVSAYLHSSTMVKAGVYLVMRLNPAFQDIPAWGWMLAGLGATTMILGAVLACRETYFKKVLAYSTVSSLGIMVLFTAIGGEYGAKAAVGYLLAHALFKACLFLTAGTVTHETGRKDIESLGGLRRTMPLTAAFGLIGALSMAGFPPLFGFVGKELLLKSSVHPTEASVLHDQAALVTTLVMIAAILTVMVSVLVGWRPFFAKQADPDEPVKGHEPGVRMLAGPAILALLTIVVPLAPALMAKPLIGAGIVSLTGAEAESVKVGFLDMLAKIELPFYLSIGALVAGTALYLARGFWRPALTATLRAFNPIGAPAIYDHSFNASAWFARFQVRQLQSGHLRRYITIIILVTVGLVVGALARSGQGIPTDISSFNVGVLDLVLLTLMVAGAVACTRYRSRLSTVAALGVVGYAVAVTFVVLGVPDIAMTQFSIETLTVIIFVLVVYHLPRFNVYSGAPRRVFDAIIALAFGAVMTSLVLVAQTNAVTGIPRISDQLGDWAYTEAFGRNVVNVILVDFRGIDTMVEIFVLGIAAVGVYTLLKLRADRPEDDKPRLTETEATT